MTNLDSNIKKQRHYFANKSWVLPGGTVVKNLPANEGKATDVSSGDTGDAGSIP